MFSVLMMLANEMEMIVRTIYVRMVVSSNYWGMDSVTSNVLIMLANGITVIVEIYYVLIIVCLNL